MAEAKNLRRAAKGEICGQVLPPIGLLRQHRPGPVRLLLSQANKRPAAKPNGATQLLGNPLRHRSRRHSRSIQRDHANQKTNFSPKIAASKYHFGF